MSGPQPVRLRLETEFSLSAAAARKPPARHRPSSNRYRRTNRAEVYDLPQFSCPQRQEISTLSAMPSQWALQYLAFSGAAQVQAALAHFLGVVVAILFPPSDLNSSPRPGTANLRAEIDADDSRAIPVLRASEIRAPSHKSLCPGLSFRTSPPTPARSFRLPRSVAGDPASRLHPLLNLARASGDYKLAERITRKLGASAMHNALYLPHLDRPRERIAAIYIFLPEGAALLPCSRRLRAPIHSDIRGGCAHF